MADSCFGGYKEYIRWAASNYRHTMYFLLVGDASDSVAWKNSSYWTNWGGPWGTPTQPENDLIATSFVPVLDPPEASWTWWTPYFSTDVGYSDIDDDGLPDVIVGRLPAHSVAQVTAYTSKLYRWFSDSGGQLGRSPAVLTRAFNHNWVPAWITAHGADSLVASFPHTVPVRRVDDIDLSGSGWPTPDSLWQVVAGLVGGESDLVVWNVNASGEMDNGFYRSDGCSDYSTMPLLPSTSRPFLSLDIACGANNYDMTGFLGYCTPLNRYVRPTPLVEKLLFDPRGGAIAQVGPTRGSFANANLIFGSMFLRRLYEPGATIGKAFLLTQRELMQKYPQYRLPIMSYALLGDPRLGPSVVTSVGVAGQARETVLLPPRPNPFNPSTEISYFVAQQGIVRLAIYDVRGRLVRELVARTVQSVGIKRVSWDGVSDSGSRVASGVYFARLEVPGVSKTRRLVLLR
jgi:hypothetical protein